MKSIHWFYFGMSIDLFILLLTASNLYMIANTLQGVKISARLMMLAMPLAILALIGIAFWLKTMGKMLAANILVWIPALPMLGGILIWGGLALLFILFGK